MSFRTLSLSEMRRRRFLFALQTPSTESDIHTSRRKPPNIGAVLKGSETLSSHFFFFARTCGIRLLNLLARTRFSVFLFSNPVTKAELPSSDNGLVRPRARPPTFVLSFCPPLSVRSFRITGFFSLIAFSFFKIHYSAH